MFTQIRSVDSDLPWASYDMALETDVQLQLHLEPAEPIAVYELTAALTALWRQYQNFVEVAEFIERPSQAKLLVSSVSPGSIDISFIPDVQDAIAATAPFVGQLKVVSDFAGHVSKLLDKFKSPAKPDGARSGITVKDCDDAINIVKPIAEHGGTQTFNVYKGPVLQQTFYVNAPEGRGIIENAIRSKAELQFPEAERHQRVPLRWFRLDINAAKQQGSSPDKVIIDEIDEKPKPVFFTDEMLRLKREMLEGDPFKKLFFVDVEVSRVAGRVVSYRVTSYHGSDDADI